MNSLRNLQQDDKLNLQHLGSGNFDWATLAGFNSFPELGTGNQSQVHLNNQNSNNNLNNLNEFFAHPTQLNFHGDVKFEGGVDEEIESGIRAQRINNSGFYQENSTGFHTYTNSVPDPFWIRYPTQTVNMGSVGK